MHLQVGGAFVMIVCSPSTGLLRPRTADSKKAPCDHDLETRSTSTITYLLGQAANRVASECVRGPCLRLRLFLNQGSGMEPFDGDLYALRTRGMVLYHLV